MSAKGDSLAELPEPTNATLNWGSTKQIASIAIAHLPLILIAIGLVRLLVVSSHTPIMGYANNYDFIREESCIGLWLHYPDKLKYANNPSAPVNTLVYDGERSPLCVRSPDLLFAALALIPHKIGDRVDFREIGVWKCALVVAIAILTLRLFDLSYQRKFFIGLLCFVVFGDLYNALYVNTLYMEFSVILGLFASVVFILLSPFARNQSGLAVALFCALLWLGLSKQQYVVLASALCFIASLRFIRERRLGKKFAALFVCVGFALPAIYGSANGAVLSGASRIRFVNKTNVVLGAALPEARDQDRALALLNLPASCKRAIGLNWYSPQMAQSHLCPEVEHIRQVNLLRLFLLEPPTFLVPLVKAIIGIRPFNPYFLGRLESLGDAHHLVYKVVKSTSLLQALEGLPERLHLWLTIGSWAGGIAGLLILVRGRPGSPRSMRRFYLSSIAMGAFVTFYAVVSSVFGDGYVDLQKHAAAFSVGVSLQLCALSVAALHYASFYRRFGGLKSFAHARARSLTSSQEASAE